MVDGILTLPRRALELRRPVQKGLTCTSNEQAPDLEGNREFVTKAIRTFQCSAFQCAACSESLPIADSGRILHLP